MFAHSTTHLSRRTFVRASLATGLAAAMTPALASATRAATMQGTPVPAGTAGAKRGAIVAALDLDAFDVDQVIGQLENLGLDSSHAQYGVRPVQVVYETIDPFGQPTTASGLIVLPDGNRPGGSDLRLVTWLHGTTVFKGEVASVSAESPDRLIAFAFASAGYAVVAPDYLGLGLGPGTHPYDDFPSTVSASLDALRATHTLAAEREVALDPRTLVTGFSQGGPSTMALGKALAGGTDPGLGLAALAPISGPYDFSGTLRAALAGEINSAPQYLAYLVVAWNRLHGLYESPSDAFLTPYDARVESLLDNTHTPDEVFAGIPLEKPEDLFTSRFLDGMRNPTGPFRKALRVADSTADWRPDVPVTFYAASGDRDVPIANAVHAQETLASHGTTSEVIDVGDVDHTTSVVLSLPLVLDQFASVK